MASRLIYCLLHLFFLFFLLTFSCFNRSSSKLNLTENKIKSNNKTEKMIKFTNTTFVISDISSSSASNENLEANIQIFSKHTGYIPIKNSFGARLFYFFYKSRGSKNDPLVLWLNGGRGKGTAETLFYDNGPFHINDDLSLKWNDFGWDKVCNILYVDQLIGTGFSYSTDNRDLRRNSKEVRNDLYEFLQAFFEAYPEFLENDFYIVGSGFSVHMAPLLASLINERNKVNEGIHINLKGLAITNGNTNPEYTQSSFPDFLYINNLISRESYVSMKEDNKECLILIQRCQTNESVCEDAVRLSVKIFKNMSNIMGKPYIYDFRKSYYNPKYNNFSNMEKFLALDEVKMALGVGNKTYVTFSEEVYDHMFNDFMKNYAGVIPQLLEDKIKVLIFDGEYDLLCNWLGNLRWTESMKWSGRNQYLQKKLIPYKIDGNEVGKIKNIGPLTFLKIFDAGHNIAKDQPNVSLQIFNKWMKS